MVMPSTPVTRWDSMGENPVEFPSIKESCSDLGASLSGRVSSLLKSNKPCRVLVGVHWFAYSSDVDQSLQLGTHVIRSDLAEPTQRVKFLSLQELSRFPGGGSSHCISRNKHFHDNMLYDLVSFCSVGSTFDFNGFRFEVCNKTTYGLGQPGRLPNNVGRVNMQNGSYREFTSIALAITVDRYILFDDDTARLTHVLKYQDTVCSVDGFRFIKLAQSTERELHALRALLNTTTGKIVFG